MKRERCPSCGTFAERVTGPEADGRPWFECVACLCIFALNRDPSAPLYDVRRAGSSHPARQDSNLKGTGSAPAVSGDRAGSSAPHGKTRTASDSNATRACDPPPTSPRDLCLCGHARAEHILGEVPCSCAHRDHGKGVFDCDCDGFELPPREVTEPAHLPTSPRDLCLCGHERELHHVGVEGALRCCYVSDCDCDGFELPPREVTEPAHLFHDGTDLSCGLCRALSAFDPPRFVHAVELTNLTGRKLRTVMRLRTTKHGRSTLLVEVRDA